MNETRCVEIDYFSDVLCIWAYVAQIKLDQVRSLFGSSTHLHCHYLSLFGDVEARIARGWRDRGGFWPNARRAYSARNGASGDTCTKITTRSRARGATSRRATVITTGAVCSA